MEMICGCGGGWFVFIMHALWTHHTAKSPPVHGLIACSVPQLRLSVETGVCREMGFSLDLHGSVQASVQTGVVVM